MLLLIAAICHCPVLHAQTEGMSLVVEMTDGTRSAFLLSEKPELTFEGGALVFRSQEAEIVVAREDFSYFHFERVEAAMPERSAGDVEAEFVTTGVLRVRGVKASAVAVYALDGSACAVDKSVEGDAVTVSLRSLPRGVYVVRYGATSIKMSNN